MEGRCESDCGGDEVYPATFGNEEKTELKLDIRKQMLTLSKRNNLSLRLQVSQGLMLEWKDRNNTSEKLFWSIIT